MRFFLMYSLWMALLVFATAGFVPAQQPAPDEKPGDTSSYAIGMNIGRSLKNSGFKADDFVTKDFLLGIIDALSGKKSRCTDEELTASFEKINQKLQARQEEMAKADAEKGKESLVKAQAFLAENKKKEGIVSLPSGLQYEVITEGKGAQPKLSSEVTVHYEGKLLNGTVFDSSIKRGESISFPVTGVIKGWTEALQRMRVGDKWRLFIPPDLAYGERGAGDDIGPNELLIFEVELLGVK